MNLKAPGVSDPYSLATLPRIPDLHLEEKVTLPVITSTSTSVIDLGVSKSIISSYLLKPTPKLIWSYPLSPSTVINGMDTFSLEHNEEDNLMHENKLYIIGLTERNKKHKLLLIHKDGSGVSNSDNVKSTCQVSLTQRVHSVKFSADGKFIYGILIDGTIQLFKVDKLDDTEEYSLVPQEIVNPELNKASSKRGSSKPQVVYHQFIVNHGFKISNDLLLTITRTNKTYVYRLVSLDLHQSFVITSTSINEPSAQLKFTYNSGVIYKLDPTNKTIHKIPTSNFQDNTQFITITPLIDDEDATLSIHCPSVDRLLISNNERIHLINYKFGSLLDTQINQGVSIINQVVQTRADTINSTVTFAIYLENDDKLNNTDLKIVHVNVGLNKLSECLGKSITKSPAADFKGLPSLLTDDIVGENAKNAETLTSVFDKLRDCADKQDIYQFDQILISFLKKIDSSEYCTFDVNNDRIIDLNFIRRVLNLVFKINDEQITAINSTFIPEISLIYLLTHPCYPFEYTKGLLKAFHDLNQPRLLRQAIITCPTISINELLSQFIQQTNRANDSDDDVYQSEILQDIILRLTSEYSITEITNHFKNFLQFLQQFNEAEYNSINSTHMLSSLVKLDTPTSLQLIQVIIDIGGLFNWSEATISQLESIIEVKLAALLENSYNLTLTNQALLQHELSGNNKNNNAHSKSKKNRKKQQQSSEDNIVANNNHQQQQLESILTISNNSSKKIYMGDEGIELSKKIPKYSIEKLIL